MCDDASNNNTYFNINNNNFDTYDNNNNNSSINNNNNNNSNKNNNKEIKDSNTTTSNIPNNDEDAILDLMLDLLEIFSITLKDVSDFVKTALNVGAGCFCAVDGGCLFFFCSFPLFFVFFYNINF